MGILDDELFEPTGQKCGSSKRLGRHTLQDINIHGLSHAYNARTIKRKVAWTILFIMCAGLLLNDLKANFERYLSLPTSTYLHESPQARLPFPAVTICNHNPMTQTNFDLISHFWREYKTRHRHDNVTEEENERGLEEMEDEPDEDLAQRSLFEYFIVRLSITRKHHLVYQRLNDMLLRCVYRGRSCSVDDFEQVINFRYGNCFTFNGKRHEDDLAYSYNAGPFTGLVLELFVNEEEYLKNISDMVGMRVMIHNQTEIPTPEKYGFSVPPGMATFVGMQRVVHTRAPPPHGKCQDISEDQLKLYSIWATSKDNITYDQQGCHYLFYQLNVHHSCGCWDPRFPIPPLFRDAATANITYCFKPQSMRCMKMSQEEEETGKVTFEKETHVLDEEFCPAPCQEIYHEVKLSSTMWPSSSSTQEILDRFENVSTVDLSERLSGLSAHEKAEYLRWNVLKLVVYFNTMEEMTITTEPSYEIVAFLSDQGGICGLWLGVSLLSLFEITEFLWDAFKLSMYNAYKNIQKRRGKPYKHPKDSSTRDGLTNTDNDQDL